MGSVTESSHLSDSGVGTKNSSRPGSRRRRRERARSATLSHRRFPVDPSARAACLMAAPPRRKPSAASLRPRRRRLRQYDGAREVD
uniref:Uncharacterized protein n=1 Tax=Triticum urartu TaxID=4572 RepID=A0A8R7QH18_TRIUA